MSIASFSIKQPIIIASSVILIIICGILSINRLGVDMYPDVVLPFVVVTTTYSGAGPEEIEEQVSKKIEDEISTIAGLKKVESNNLEGISLVYCEFTLDSDIKYCEQQVRDKIAKIRNTFPDGTDEPKIERWDMAKDPIITIALEADIPDAKIYDLANEKIKPLLEQISHVGTVVITGGTRREIQVELDRDILNKYKIPATVVVDKLKQSGMNVPSGKQEKGIEEKTIRSVGRYKTIHDIENSVILFSGDANNSVTLKSLGTVKDSTKDKTTLGYMYNPYNNISTQPKGFFSKIRDKLTGKDSEIKPNRNIPTRSVLFIGVYKQSGTNTVRVVDDVYKKIKIINAQLDKFEGNPKLIPVYDSSTYIRVNIEDVNISITLGIILAIVIVYLFLGNIRSTLITGIALPVSLFGGFILMYIMGFTINIMTLLALSLSVGLLIDDAIVVRENIFRKLENKMSPEKAATTGTMEVLMAVVATTITIIAVFFPVGFMDGVVGRFFKQFGLTIVFAMIVSLFDSLTVAPFLSAYFSNTKKKKLSIIPYYFEKFQVSVGKLYERIMKISIAHPGKIIIGAFIVFIASLGSLFFVESTFMPAPDDRDFKLSIELPFGTSLQGTKEAAEKIEILLKDINEIEKYALLVGNTEGKSNFAEFYISLLPESYRTRTNTQIKEKIRTLLNRNHQALKPILSEYTIGDPFPFSINIEGENLNEMEKYAKALISKLKTFPELIDIQTTYENSKPEYQVILNNITMSKLGINAGMAGSEIRYHIEGEKVGKLYDRGYEYDIRVRLKKSQRDIKNGYTSTKIPNINGMMIPLNMISHLEEKNTPSQIRRENRKRIIQITANISPGQALGTAANKVKILSTGELKVPAGMSLKLVGDSENMDDLMSNIIMAIFLSIVIIYLVLSSLYKSFITPFSILIAILPALSGAIFALAITGKTLDIFSMIGIVMLMGLVTKNSILLVDYAVKYTRKGMDRKEAIMNAGKLRLRPILMTTFAMLAGTIPVAFGIGEAAKTRMSMGIAILGGIILSTVLTLIVVPSIFSYVDRFRVFIEKPFSLKTKKNNNE